MFPVTKKEKRLRLYFLVFYILYLAMLVKCSGQTSSYPLKFSCGKVDTIYIYINTDSLNTSRLFVNCSAHQHKSWISVTLGFVDGEMMELKSKDCYLIKDVEKLKSAKFDYVSFDEFLSSTACINIRTKDYFVRFFNPEN